MDYRTVERDFVERSIGIIKQYERFVMPHVGIEEQYEVTLLLNCLLGLIILPYEHSKREQGGIQFPKIFAGDDQPIYMLGSEWGLKDINIECFKLDGKYIELNDITLRQLVAMFRHSMAHSQFGNGANDRALQGLSVNYKNADHNAIKSLILEVKFVNEHRQSVEFRARIPVISLKIFAICLANAFLKNNCAI